LLTFIDIVKAIAWQETVMLASFFSAQEKLGNCIGLCRVYISWIILLNIQFQTNYQVSIRIFKSLCKSSRCYSLHLVSFVWLEGESCILLELQVNYSSQI